MNQPVDNAFSFGVCHVCGVYDWLGYLTWRTSDFSFVTLLGGALRTNLQIKLKDHLQSPRVVLAGPSFE